MLTSCGNGEVLPPESEENRDKIVNEETVTENIVPEYKCEGITVWFFNGSKSYCLENEATKSIGRY